jgi:hypothetical protein
VAFLTLRDVHCAVVMAATCAPLLVLFYGPCSCALVSAVSVDDVVSLTPAVVTSVRAKIRYTSVGCV